MIGLENEIAVWIMEVVWDVGKYIDGHCEV